MKKEVKSENPKINAVIQRAKELKLISGRDDMLSVLMDIESAYKHFDMDMEKWLSFDDFNFAHDFNGIRNNIVRDHYPATNFNFFIPRCTRSNAGAGA